MDPVSIIVTALATGAAAGLKPTAEQIIKDAYEGVKALIKRKFSAPINIGLLERDPASKAKQEVVREELNRLDASSDHELLAQAKALLDLIRERAPETPETIGVRLEDIVAASLTLDDILSSSTGVTANKLRIEGDIRISGIRAGIKHSIPSSRESNGDEEDNSNGVGPKSNLQMDRVKARDIVITQQYLIGRGVVPYQDYLDGVLTPRDFSDQGTVDVDNLRKKLLRLHRLPDPVSVTVRGTLYPCALLTAGWWDRLQQQKTIEPRWHDNIQKWLFHGFDLWGPSWDFTWSELHNEGTSYVIAQLGSGDEADSIPVLIPLDKAVRLQAFFNEKWGGGDVEVTGLLGHRSHFSSVHKDVDLIGGLLDYCLWIDPDNEDHAIRECSDQTEVYSGYLWKCVIPRAWFKPNDTPALDKVYFVWEHTNLRDQDAINYNLDSLAHKERYLANTVGPLVLLQKSSKVVPGRVEWTTSQFYEVFVSGTIRKII